MCWIVLKDPYLKFWWDSTHAWFLLLVLCASWRPQPLSSQAGWLKEYLVSIHQLTPKRIRQGNVCSEKKYLFQCTLMLISTNKWISQSCKGCLLLEYAKFTLQILQISKNTVKIWSDPGSHVVSQIFVLLLSLISSEPSFCHVVLSPLLHPSVTLYRCLSVMWNEFLPSSHSLYYIWHRQLTFALHSLLHVFKLPQSSLWVRLNASSIFFCYKVSFSHFLLSLSGWVVLGSTILSE